MNKLAKDELDKALDAAWKISDRRPEVVAETSDKRALFVIRCSACGADHANIKTIENSFICPTTGVSVFFKDVE